MFNYILLYIATKITFWIVSIIITILKFKGYIYLSQQQSMSLLRSLLLRSLGCNSIDIWNLRLELGRKLRQGLRTRLGRRRIERWLRHGLRPSLKCLLNCIPACRGHRGRWRPARRASSWPPRTRPSSRPASPADRFVRDH